MNTSNPRGNFTGGGGRGGFRGGGRGGHQGGHQRSEGGQKQDETPDHSATTGITGLLTRLGDTYLTMGSATHQNLYNHYHHQFDVSLPAEAALEPFYTDATPLHKQIHAISHVLKPFVKSTTKEHVKDLETIFFTLFRSLIAFPTKVPVYAALVAHLGIESPNFLQKVINEAYKQLEAAIRGLFVLMLLDDKKKSLTIGGTAKSKVQLQLIRELEISATPTTTITTPAIAFEAMMRFIACLVGYNCIPTSTWIALCVGLRQLTGIPFDKPHDGNYDQFFEAQEAIHNARQLEQAAAQAGTKAKATKAKNASKSSTMADSDHDITQWQPVYLANALPFELSNIGGLLEKIAAINISTDKPTDLSSIVSKTRGEDDAASAAMGEADGKGAKKGDKGQEDKSVYDDEDDAAGSSSSSGSLVNQSVATSGAAVQYTAFNDIIVHGLLSALVFASRDVLNLGPKWNQRHNGIEFFQEKGKTVEGLVNRDSVLFNVVTNWAITDDSTNFQDLDLELDYDYQGAKREHVVLNGQLAQEDKIAEIVLDGVTLNLAEIELFYVDMLLAISKYLHHRADAFTLHTQLIQAKKHTTPALTADAAPSFTSPSLFYNSPYTTHAASTFEFYSEPSKFYYSALPAPNLTPLAAPADPLAGRHFDYLVWSYWSITGSLPDGRVHILRPQQADFAANATNREANFADSTRNLHQWGLLTRPFSITTPSFTLFRKDVQNHYLTKLPQTGAKKDDDETAAAAAAKKRGEEPSYTFICPGPLDTKTVYIIPQTTLSSQGNVAAKGSATTTTTKKSTTKAAAATKFSKKIADHIPKPYDALFDPISAEGTSQTTPTPIYFITQPANFPVLLPMLPHPRAKAVHQPENDYNSGPMPSHHTPPQANHTILPNTNNVDVWLTYSYLFYSNITYAGLQDEYFSFLSTLPPLYPIFGESQTSLYATDPEGQLYRKYTKPYSSTSLQRSMTFSSIPLLQSFFFGLLLSTNSNFQQPLTSPLLNHADAPQLLHNDLTSSPSSYFSNILIRLLYEHSSNIPPHFGPRFFNTFRLIHHFPLHTILRFAQFFATYLCQFNFQFPLSQFTPIATKNDPTDHQFQFLSYVLAHCVKLTSFSTVASNCVELWPLLPPVKFYMDQADHNHLLQNNITPSEAGLTDPQSVLILPQVFPQQDINNTILALQNALLAKVPTSILLSTLFASNTVVSPQTVDNLKQQLAAFPSVTIASAYALDATTKNNFFTVQQAASFGVSEPSNCNPFAVFLFLALLSASRKTNTHFLYYLTAYGDLLALLSNTMPGDLLHDGLGKEMLLNNNNDDDGDGDGMGGQKAPTAAQQQLTTKLFTNSHFHQTPPQLPDNTDFHNGFVQCTLINSTAQPLKSTITLTATSALPHPTQIVLLDCLYMFHFEDLTHLPVKLQHLLSRNIISIQSYFLWVLFYLPRYSTSSTCTIFALNLLDLVELGLNIYLMANNEKESKLLDLFKTSFASISTQTIVQPTTATSTTTATTTTALTHQATEVIPGTDANQQIAAKLGKILQSQSKITSFKAALFSTIFALIFDWIPEASTLLGVLQALTAQRARALQDYNDVEEIDANQDGTENEPTNNKRQRLENDGGNDQFDDLSEIALLHGTPEDFSFKAAQFALFIITQYKLPLRNISQDVLLACQIPGLDTLLRQIFE